MVGLWRATLRRSLQPDEKNYTTHNAVVKTTWRRVDRRLLMCVKNYKEKVTCVVLKLYGVVSKQWGR